MYETKVREEVDRLDKGGHLQDLERTLSLLLATVSYEDEDGNVEELTVVELIPKIAQSVEAVHERVHVFECNMQKAVSETRKASEDAACLASQNQKILLSSEGRRKKDFSRLLIVGGTALLGIGLSILLGVRINSRLKLISDRTRFLVNHAVNGGGGAVAAKSAPEIMSTLNEMRKMMATVVASMTLLDGINDVTQELVGSVERVNTNLKKHHGLTVDSFNTFIDKMDDVKVRLESPSPMVVGGLAAA